MKNDSTCLPHGLVGGGKGEDLLEEHRSDKDQDVMDKLEARAEQELHPESLDQGLEHVCLEGIDRTCAIYWLLDNIPFAKSFQMRNHLHSLRLGSPINYKGKLSKTKSLVISKKILE